MAYVTAILVFAERLIEAGRRRAERARLRRIADTLPPGIRSDIGWNATAGDGCDRLQDR